MAHLSKFGLGNFRVFKGIVEFELAPLTILTGPNNSGKSSLIKALLLMQDNIVRNIDIEYREKLTDLEDLDFTKGEHKAGNFEISLNKNANEQQMVFLFPFHFDEITDEMTLELSYALNKNNILKNGILNTIRVYTKREDVIQLKRLNSHEWEIFFKFSYFRPKLNEIIRIQKIREEKFEEIEDLKQKLGDYKIYSQNPHYKKLSNELYGDKSKYYDNSNKSEIHFDIVHPSALPFSLRFSNPETYKRYHSDLPLSILTLILINNPDHLHLNDLSGDDYLSVKNDLLKAGVDESYLNSKKTLLAFLHRKFSDINNEIKIKLIDAGFKFENDQQLVSQLREDELRLMENIKKTYDWKQPISKKVNACVIGDIAGPMAELGSYLQSIQSSYRFTYSKFHHALFKSIDEEVKSKSIYHAFIEAFNEIISKDDVFEACFQLINSIKDNTNNSVELFYLDFLTKGFKESFNRSVNTFKHITSLEAVRANMQRVYSFNSQGTSFNNLLLEFNSLGLENNAKEINFISKWLKNFNIGEKIQFILADEGFGTKIMIDEHSLADKGYGITQFLPILLKIAIAASKNYDALIEISGDMPEYESSIILIEEPETNLHPRLQSLLADMFIDAAKEFHIQFIIETHSEYLIRKLQYLTANKEHEYNINPEDTAIYYFNDPKTLKKGDKQVRRIRIQENGILDGNFGSGFFDEASNLIKEIFKLSGAN